MKKVFLLAIFLIGSNSIVLAQGNSVSDFSKIYRVKNSETDTTDWMPLHIGNQWQYFGNNYYMPYSYYAYFLRAMQINDTIYINNKKYYRINGFFDFPNNTPIRYDPDSQQIRIYYNNQDRLFMDFSLPEGASFTQVIPRGGDTLTVTVVSDTTTTMGRDVILKGFRRELTFPYWKQGWYYFSPGLGYVEQIEPPPIGLQTVITYTNFNLIECILYDSTNFITHYKHGYSADIQFNPIRYLSDSINVLNENFQILHHYSVKSYYPYLLGVSYISNASIESYYSNGSDSIPNSVSYLNHQSEIDFTLQYALDTNLFNQGYKLFYRIVVKDKGIIPSYYYKPATGYYELSWGDTTTTFVKRENQNVNSFSLLQNYPNPFNPTTKISWQSPVGSWQTLKVYDVLGREVATLVNEYKPAGKYEFEFDGSNLPSGIYFYSLNAGSFKKVRKMILLK